MCKCWVKARSWSLISTSQCRFSYFLRTGTEGWRSLGGVLLCVTGCEALFADLGHFSRKSIQVSFSFLAWPCLILTYLGQVTDLILRLESHPCHNLTHPTKIYETHFIQGYSRSERLGQSQPFCYWNPWSSKAKLLSARWGSWITSWAEIVKILR